MLDVPDGASRADVDREAARQGLSVGPPPPENPRSLTNLAGAAIEPNLALASGAAAAPAAGIAGLIGAALPGPPGQGADWTRSVLDKLQYEPRTTGGRNAMSVIGAPFEWLGEKAHNVGGAVSEATNSPALGAAANTAVQAIPAFAGARSMGLPAAADTAAGAGGLRVMRAALKPGTEEILSGKADRAAGTMMREGINPTAGGMERVHGQADQLDQGVKNLLKQSPATVSVPGIASRVDPIGMRALQQNAPMNDVGAISGVLDEFYNHPLIAGRNDIPVALAHALKQGTYRELGNKAYGEMKTMPVEAQKALARGERETIAEAVPRAARDLAQESDLRNVLDVAGSRAAQESKRGAPPLLYLSRNPLSSMGYAATTSANLQSLLARALYQMGDPAARRAGIAAGGISQEQPQNGLQR